MVSILSKLNPFVTAAFAAVIAFPLHAEETVEQRLLRELRDPQNTAWQRLSLIHISEPTRPY